MRGAVVASGIDLMMTALSRLGKGTQWENIIIIKALTIESQK
jgi:hypothetical protein